MNKLKKTKLAVFLCSVCMLTAVCVAQETKTDEAKEAGFEPAKMVGEWAFESGVRMGDEVAKERLGTVSISEKEFTIPVPGAESFVMAYTLDTEHDPAHVDLQITGGPAPAADAKGIITMEDGKIKLCYHPTGGDRPDSFESTADNGCHTFVIAKAGMSAEDLVGTWSYAAGTRAGAEVAAERLAGDVVFTEDTVSLGAGEAAFVMGYTLDTEASPIEIDMVVKSGPAPEGMEAKGIIKMDGDHLVFCYDATTGTRPDSFESTADNGMFLFKLTVKEDE